MSRLSRKFVAVLLLLWLPLFSASAVAASVSMQMPQGHCEEAAASQAMDDMDMAAMQDMDMSEHLQHHGETPAMADEPGPSCSSCGICHLACTAYVGVPAVELAALQASSHEIAPALLAFHSITSVPLLPPPLARV
jgi:ferredoxin